MRLDNKVDKNKTENYIIIGLVTLVLYQTKSLIKLYYTFFILGQLLAGGFL